MYLELIDNVLQNHGSLLQDVAASVAADLQTLQYTYEVGINIASYILRKNKQFI